MDDLRARLDCPVQLTDDGHKAYLDAFEGAFGGDIDSAQLVRMYGGESGSMGRGKKYAPAARAGIRKRTVEGAPEPRDISTSCGGRSNLTMRMSMRRFTRPANAFSNRIGNHAHSVALHFMHNNFCRVHMTLKPTPAVAARVTDRIHTIDDFVRLVDEAAPKPGHRGPCKKRNSN